VGLSGLGGILGIFSEYSAEFKAEVGKMPLRCSQGPASSADLFRVLYSGWAMREASADLQYSLTAEMRGGGVSVTRSGEESGWSSYTGGWGRV
jgi:hypothetical protein